MDNLLILLASYGVCFGLMNEKVPWLNSLLYWAPLVRDEAHGTNLFSRMFGCAYCTGFHTSWGVFLAHSAVEGSVGFLTCIEALLFGFAGSAFCYALDTALRWLERE